VIRQSTAVPAEIVVLPTHAHAAFARAEEALADPRRIAMGRGVITLGELVDAVVAAALPGMRVLGPLEERLVLRSTALSDVARKGRFAQVAAAPGFIGALGATVAACRKAGVSAAHLDSVRGALPRGVAARTGAVAALLAEVDAHIARLGAADRDGVLWSAAEALRAGAPLPTMLPVGARVTLRHVHELSPARLAFLDALAVRLGPSGDVVVELPHDECEGPWFGATARVLSRAEAGGGAASLSLHPTSPAGEARGVGAFVSDALARGTSEHPPARVEVIEAPSPAAEHALVARRVRDLVDAGVPPERIAVAAREADVHAGPLAAALRDAGVPVHERRGTPAADTPPLRFLFDVMSAAADGLPRDAVLRLVASGYAGRWEESRGKAGEVARVLGQVGVRSEPAGRRQKGRVGAALIDALDRLAADEDAPRTLPMVRAAVADFAERAAPLGEPATIVELVARVRRFVDISGLADTARRPTSSLRELISEDVRDPAAAAEARSFGRDQAALDALEAALDELEEAARRVGFGGVFDPAAQTALIRDALSGYAVGSGGLRGGAVRVVGLRDLAGLPVEAVFLVGLTGSELPAPAIDDPLLSISDRHAVARALAQRADGPRYTFDVDEDTRMGAVAFATGREVEPLLFYLAAATPLAHLVLCRSTTDPDGRPVVASPILDDALDALARAGAEIVVDTPPVEPAPSLVRAASFDDARRAWVRSLAEVGPAMSAVDAAERDPRPRLPDDDPLDVRAVLERVVVERARLSTMLDAESLAPAGPFCGQLGEGERPQRLSASALEDLARCPFLYFAKRMLHLDSDRAGEDDPDARQKGTAAHACFQAAIEALIAGGFVPYDQARVAEAMAEARRAAEEVARIRFGTLPLDEHLLGIVQAQTVDRVVAVVRGLYEADDGFLPVAVERGFGPTNDDAPGPSWPAVEVAGVALRGRIDLVEQRGDAIRVTDLKSGSRAGLEGKLQPDALGVAELQLPIYAAAASSALGAKDVDARYLSLRDGEPSASVSHKRATGRNWKKDPRSDEDVLAVVREDGSDTALGGRIRDLVERIAFGDFEVKPRKDACRYCDYAGVCRLPRGAPDAEDGA